MTLAIKTLKKRIEDFTNKIPNSSGLVKKTDYKTKVTEIENKIPNITSLVITTVEAVEIENKIPDITGRATKAPLNTKTARIENKKNLILLILLILKNLTD